MHIHYPLLLDEFIYALLEKFSDLKSAQLAGESPETVAQKDKALTETAITYLKALKAEQN